MVIVVDNHNEGHHIHWIDMHLGLDYTYKKPEEVVAKKSDQFLETPPIFDSQILDACCHCSFRFLQHS
ncbi:hypothetical protein AHAS_Ahas15G0208100 [Arachis hypogaea]